MKAYLYDVKRYYTDSEYPNENEFIVVVNSEKDRDEEASRVYEWYLEQAKPGLTNTVLGEPQLIEDELYLEDMRKTINWRILKKRQLEQHKNRPRGIGCTFRGGSPDPQEDSTNEEIEDLKESIKYFMGEHRLGDESFLFVGSKWKLKNRLRYGKIAVFEACGIELASDIAQLEFISPKHETVYVNWCCPIYVV